MFFYNDKKKYSFYPIAGFKIHSRKFRLFFERNDFIIISLMIRLLKLSKVNKDEHVPRFELGAIRGELLREERERKRESAKERE